MRMKLNSRFPMIVLLVVVLFSSFHSYLVLTTKLTSPLLSIFIGSWKEMLFFALGAWFVLRWIFFRVAIKNKGLWFATIVLTIYGVAIGATSGASAFEVVVNARDFMLPLFFYLIVCNLPLATRRSIKLAVLSLIILLAVHGIVSLYNYITFDGRPESIWVYEIFSNLEKGVSFGTANFIRDGKLRAMGFFVSPLEYSMTLLFALFLLTFYFVLSRSLLTKLLVIILMGVFLLFLLIAGVRVWIISYMLGIVTIGLLHMAKKINNKKIIYILSPLALVTITFVNIIFDFGMNDLSSLGRLDQYVLVPLMMIQHPLGLGFGDIGSKGSFSADSGVLTLLMAFGWAFVGLYLFVIVRIFMKPVEIMHQIASSKTNYHFRVFVLALGAYSIASMYTIFFHESIFYNFQYLLFIFLALATRRLETEKTLQNSSVELLNNWNHHEISSRRLTAFHG